MPKSYWDWFKSLKSLNKFNVVAGVATIVGLFCTVLTLPSALSNRAAVSTSPRNDSIPPLPHFGDVHVGNGATNSVSTVNLAAGDLTVEQNYPSQERFVNKVFLKPEADGQPPRVLNSLPGTMLARLVLSKDPTEALGVLVDSGFFCEPGAEVELLEDNTQSDSLAGKAVDSLHSRIRVLNGTHKSEEGWVRKNLLEYKQVRDSDTSAL